jgi:hypothetical protein
MRKSINGHLDKIEKQTVEEMVLAEQNLQVELKKVLVAMETKRTDFDNIRQDVNKVKKYAIDLQMFIGVNKMTSVVDGEVKKQKGAFNNDLFELKLNFSSELESFPKDVSKFGVVSVTTSIVVPVLLKKLNRKHRFQRKASWVLHHNSQERRLSIFKLRLRGLSV